MEKVPVHVDIIPYLFPKSKREVEREQENEKASKIRTNGVPMDPRPLLRQVAQKMGLIFGRSSKNENLFKKPLKKFSKSAILTSARAKRSAPPSPKPLTKNKSRSEE